MAAKKECLVIESWFLDEADELVRMYQDNQMLAARHMHKCSRYEVRELVLTF